jgi:magnesium-transporting ATPase (P-type)
VKVESEELFPTDLILLSTSIEGGVAYIETASLDGEKNLKPRNAFAVTQKYNTIDSLSNLCGSWKGILPNKELHEFSSNLTLQSGETINYYKDKQLLYRGARLKNTKWIYGLSIYTGRNSKIMMNSDSTAEKMSQIEVKVNYILGLILGLQVILCFIMAILDGVFINNNAKNNSYIQFSNYASSFDSFLIWCTYMVLLNTMIPISLVVSMEVVKMSQSYFIDKDKLMYSEFRKRYSNVKSASLNEELGQI